VVGAEHWWTRSPPSPICETTITTALSGHQGQPRGATVSEVLQETTAQRSRDLKRELELKERKLRRPQFQNRLFRFFVEIGIYKKIERAERTRRWWQRSRRFRPSSGDYHDLTEPDVAMLFGGAHQRISLFDIINSARR